MIKYEYVAVKIKNNPPGSAYLNEHRNIINDYASKGYEYAGFIPVKQGASGKIVEADLIFKIDC